MIYIIWAPPRKGKTYYATYWAISILKAIYKNKGNKKFVFSNYPIHHKKYGSTLFWNKNSYQYNIHDSVIIIDEAYRDYNSRKYHKFSTNEHTFFATNGHDNNDIILICHGIHRIDPVIREMVDTYYYVKKITFPFSEKPLWFIVEGFLDEIEIANRYRYNTVYSKFFLRFKKEIGNSYDTHYFRKPDNEKFDLISWDDVYNEKYLEIEIEEK